MGLCENGNAQVEIFASAAFAYKTKVTEPSHLAIEFGNVVLHIGTIIFIIPSRNTHTCAY
jgi:hypothetical protein